MDISLGLGTVAGGLVGGAFGMFGAKADRDFQREMYERQRQDALEDYEMQKRDTISMMQNAALYEKQGLQNAGISTALKDGDFGSPQSLIPKAEPLSFGNGGGAQLAQAGTAFADIASKMASIQLMKAQAQEAEKKAGLISSQDATIKAKLEEYNTNLKGLIRKQYLADIEKTNLEAERLRLTNPKEAERLLADIEEKKARVRNLDQSTDLLSVNTDTARKMQPKQLKQADLNIQQAFMNLKKTAEQINELKSRQNLQNEQAATQASVRAVNMATAENQYEQANVNQWKALSEQYKTNVSKLQSAMADVGILDGQNEFQAGLTSALVAGDKIGVNMEVFTPLMANGAYCYQTLLQGIGASSELISSAASLTGAVGKVFKKGVTNKNPKSK